jgi:excisionase family DNA binding protein
LRAPISLPTSADLAELEPRQIPALLAALAAMQAQLAARLLAAEEPSPSAQAEAYDDKMLTVGEAAAMLRKSAKWIYRHRNLPFVKKVGGGLLISKQDLERWLTRQKA